MLRTAAAVTLATRVTMATFVTTATLATWLPWRPDDYGNRVDQGDPHDRNVRAALATCAVVAIWRAGRPVPSCGDVATLRVEYSDILRPTWRLLRHRDNRRHDARRRFSSVLLHVFPRLMYALYEMLSRCRDDRHRFANVLCCAFTKIMKVCLECSVGVSMLGIDLYRFVWRLEGPLGLIHN